MLYGEDGAALRVLTLLYGWSAAQNGMDFRSYLQLALFHDFMVKPKNLNNHDW
jgi:hypothetical protein